MKEQLIIFDIDGTLSDSVQIHKKAYELALEEMGIQAPAKGFGTFKHHTDSYIFKELFEQYLQRTVKKSDFDLFYERLEYYFEKSNGHPIQEISGAENFVKHLIKNDIPFVYATGSIHSLAVKKLEAVGLVDQLEILSASNNFESREEIIEHAIELGKKYYDVTEFKDHVVIGDGKWDYDSARLLAFDFIGIGNSTSLLSVVEEDAPYLWSDFKDKSIAQLTKNKLVNSRRTKY